jgi:uncharacterized oligopeptide transporter (OPT) family protein
MKCSIAFVQFQIMVIDYKLPYPSGTATAVLINGFHTTHGDAKAKYVVLSDYSLSLSLFAVIKSS